MKDIRGIEDITLLVNTFYDEVKQDQLIGHIFHAIIGDDWSRHLPVMYSFWNTILFAHAGYRGNPVKTHIDVNRNIPLDPGHFERWIFLWTKTVDSLFAGPVAEDAKYKAGNMLQLIRLKIAMHNDGKTLI